ncbi:MAG: T9SS C-terminal target domain-containing protein [Gemmatimonadetes bacterium]|nr:MAG: T9SS C-terminal target domain-containing protein [Gemmatimonadota bacterium]
MNKLVCLVLVVGLSLLAIPLYAASNVSVSVDEEGNITSVQTIGHLVPLRSSSGELRLPPSDPETPAAPNIRYGSSSHNPLTTSFERQVVRVPGTEDMMFIYESDDNDADNTATELKYGLYINDFLFWDVQSITASMDPEVNAVRRKALTATSDGALHAVFGYSTIAGDRGGLRMGYATYDPISQSWAYQRDLNPGPVRGFSYPVIVTNSHDELYVALQRYTSNGVNHDGHYYFVHTVGGDWSSLDQVVDEPVGQYGWGVCNIAADPVTDDLYIFWPGEADSEGDIGYEWPDIRVKKWSYDTQTWDPEDPEIGYTAVAGGPEYMYYPYESPEDVRPDAHFAWAHWPMVTVDSEGYIHVITLGNQVDQPTGISGSLSFYYSIGVAGVPYYSRSVNPRDPSEFTPPQRIFQTRFEDEDGNVFDNDVVSGGQIAIDEDDNLYFIFGQWEGCFFSAPDADSLLIYTGPQHIRMTYFDRDHESGWWSQLTEDVFTAPYDTTNGIEAGLQHPTCAAHVEGPSDFPDEPDKWGLPVLANVHYDLGGATPPYDIFYIKAPYQPEWLYDIDSVEPEQTSVAVPAVAKLHQNYPNPFNPRTTITYDVIQAGHIRLAIYNMKGELVKELVNHNVAEGSYSVTWDGMDTTNQPVPSGMYTYRLETDDHILTRTMVLMK